MDEVACMVFVEGLKVYFFVNCTGMGAMLLLLKPKGIMLCTAVIFRIWSESLVCMPITDNKRDDRSKKKLV